MNRIISCEQKREQILPKENYSLEKCQREGGIYILHSMSPFIFFFPKRIQRFFLKHIQRLTGPGTEYRD